MEIAKNMLICERDIEKGRKGMGFEWEGRKGKYGCRG